MSDDESPVRPSSSWVGKKKDNMRYGGTRSLASLVPGLTKKAVGKRGFTDARILNEWDQIVGADLARHAHPDRLTFPRGRRDAGTLHIRALGPMATELQHLEPVLVSRINMHFGYKAISGIKLMQVPPTRLANQKSGPGRLGAAPKRPQTPANPEQLAQMKLDLQRVEDPELRAILMRIGESVLRRDAAKKTKD
ncbi:MAG: DciA family protein [Alphaproteobacteria bacterium]|nr:DciA family protein [Alphaproteobacteria bacterium]